MLIPAATRVHFYRFLCETKTLHLAKRKQNAQAETDANISTMYRFGMQICMMIVLFGAVRTDPPAHVSDGGGVSDGGKTKQEQRDSDCVCVCANTNSSHNINISIVAKRFQHAVGSGAAPITDTASP